MKKLCALVALMAFVPSFLLAQQWVDMGVRADNGDVIYWSNSDFAMFTNGAVGFVEKGEIGSTVGWGDITGKIFSRDLSNFGGANPPNSIEGNSKFDIITANFGKSFRLPTANEFQRLIDNCTISRTTLEKKRGKGKDGLPSWVQGQWMWHSSALVNGRPLNASITLKIDGLLASVYTSEKEYWEGSYSYSNGTLKVWKLLLKVNENEKTIKDDRGYQYQKISNSTESGKYTAYIFKSKINGNELLFAMPTAVSAGTAGGGQYTIAWNNPQEMVYWTGTLYQQDKECAATFTLTNSGQGLTAVKRAIHNRVRAVKVDVGSGARLAEEKRIAEEKAAGEKARQEELERQRLEEERVRLEQLRAEAYANDPIIKALSMFESKENLSDLFDFKMYYEVPNVAGIPQKRGVLLFLNANKKTQEIYERYKQLVGNRTRPDDTYRQFVEEKFNEVLPNIIAYISNFSIVDADGHTYSFKLTEKLPQGLEQKSWLRYEIIGTPSYSPCMLRANLDERAVGNLNIGTINLGNIPFLQKEHRKGEKLYYCDFQLPFSSSYSIIANGKSIKGEKVDYSEFSQLRQGKSMTEIIVRSSADMRRNTQQNYNRQRQIYRR